MKRRKRSKLFWGAILCTIAIELFLRFAFGLGTPVLVQADPLTGYRFQPNQHVIRFGRTIAYNQYSQRSSAIALPKPPGTLRILMVGDSVLNGGTPIAQKETITALFQTQLSKTFPSVEVLNASAGSWGIGNQLGYLQEFGLFESDALILQIGTHDLVQPTSTSDRVGTDPNYPNRRPLLALQEVLTRYILPRMFPPKPLLEIPAPTNPERQFRNNLQSLGAIVRLARSQNIPIFVLYTPNWTDLLPVPNEPPFKTEFLNILTQYDIHVFDSQAAWSKQPPATVQTYFRDSVHLTVAGHQALVKLLNEENWRARLVGRREIEPQPLKARTRPSLQNL